MNKIYNGSELFELNNLTAEVVESIRVTIDILNENYGVDRSVDSDLGGYMLIVENIVDIEILKQDKLQGLVPEYTDIIECSEGVNWTSSLFLLSSEFRIVSITIE